MRIALIGYGKMGRAIERIAIERGHEISARIDMNPDDWNQIKIGNHDAAIEFTTPASAPENIKKCLEHAIPVVSGTTGWLSERQSIEDYCKQKGGAFFYASNYSLGVNLFFKLNEYLAKLINPYEQYDISIEETHHTQKKDAPSGTAITLAEGILRHLKRKTAWTRSQPASADEIYIESKRVDPYPGQHIIRYKSEVDDIEISHTAHSREGFALGAVLVAEWIRDKKGVLDMNDFLKL